MAEKKHLITAEDLYRLQVLSDVRLAPDSQHVIYTLQRVDRKSEKKYSNLWVVPTNGGSPQQFTQGDQRDLLPRWSPDGKQIVFLSNRNSNTKPPQVYLIPFDRGEARPLADLDGEISSLDWSPDGRKLLCRIRKLDPDAIERQKDQEKKELGVIARHYNRLFYKLDEYGYLPHERWHLWLVDTRTARTKQLTDHPIWDERDPAWSPDGKSIVFVSNHSDDPDQNPDADDLFIIPATGGEPVRIELPLGEKSKPAFSPDGKWIAYYAQKGEANWYQNLGLWVIPVDGSKVAKNLTARYDLHVSPNVINDLGTPEAIRPIWSNDGKSIYFPAVYHGSSLLKNISLDGKILQDVIGEGGAILSYGFDKAQNKVAYHYGRMDDPGQVYVRELASGTTRHLTRLNRDVLDKLDLGKIEEVRFKGPDGNDLQGWIIKPPGFNARRKYPSILEIHGGPLTQYGKLFMHEFYYLAANGYVVYFSNPRGGRGYGEKHAKAIWGGWGGVDYADLMAWTDYISALPYIDTKRMGVTGGSYGGYMTVWIIGHTDRFKAAVSQRCVSNLISMWGSSDFNWIFQQELEVGAPFEGGNLKKFWDHSPIKYIANARTPTLVIHSENDHRCPIEQSEQVFVALKRLKVDTEFVRFPAEFHGLSRTGRTDRRVARLNHILRWFDRYLK
jgi:dipeptidyl aminopeptidase/acylaminoacyl peptidase